MGNGLLWIAEFLQSVADVGDVRLDYMPLWISDFLADDNVEMMNTEQRGAYLLLMMRGWQQQPPASLPDDDVRLAKWAGLSKGRWERVKELVLKPFDKGEDGRFYQKRLAREWLNSARNYTSKRRGAEITNAKKREHSAHAERDAERDAQRTHQPTNPTKPQLPNPPQPPNGGGRVSLSESGVGLGNLELGKIEIQSLLAREGVSTEAQTALLGRKDVTAERVRAAIADIKRDPSVSNIAAVLVHRLNLRRAV
jgi:uncharacterized protein YdaU (DUF1376 family)